ncbi:MAG: pentapeptide repeat-containing protein [Caldilineaceae bacterium]|nr:pentapeptide repeat-containing protein [Caldilineaceae bacterium]
MKKLSIILCSTLLLALFALSFRFGWQPQQAVAAPSEQGLMGLPLEFYLLVNQRSDLWLVRMDMRDVYLPDINLSNANLSEALLTRATLANANLSGARLSRTNFVSANLSGVNLTGADLTRALLQSSDLRGADLTDAILDNANFAGSRYDDSTIWPEGFDVEASGATSTGPTSEIASTP